MEHPTHPESDRVAGKVEALAALFPNVVSEVLDDQGIPQRAIDFDLLRQELSDRAVEGPAERYRLDWPGKRAAAASANQPSGKHPTLDTERSLNPDSSANTLIVGDNLDALKLLRETHAGAVKLIYIDPPYNTRNDFVYNDDFAETTRVFRARSEHVDDTADGRFHSAWLSMMYPRLLLARELLTVDGVGFVSIDGNELAQLGLLLAEVFGPDNVVATIVWVSNLKGRQLGAGGPAGTHEYILCFARNADAIAPFRGSASEFNTLMPAVYRRSGYPVKQDARGEYVTKNELYNTNSRFNEVTAPTMVFRIHFHPRTGEVRVSDVDDDTEFPGFVTAMPHANHRPNLRWHAWRWSRAKVLTDHEDLEFDVSGATLRIRTKVRDVDGMTMKDVVLGPSTMSGQADLDALGMHHLFDSPKPVELLRTLIAVTTSDDDLVLDFFAGSGTTAEAVMRQNALDGAHRRFLLVQLDEHPPARSDAAKAGFASLADVTIERMRRAGLRIHADAGANASDLDTGFRVLKLR
ncbi:site-specific DNA-methyltransferase [Humibacter sp. RRB41]|uniref:site-specific DNA-methyltransferase n=1 Tax=Humibacter sp. RRB41 TaxID=2919946 RepID=UPI001FA966E2|nr:site-specific DNA-methyltransferase [Humibacter sp. RRB41]